MPLNVPIGRAKYIWAFGIDPNSGRGAVVGPFRDEEIARRETSDFDNVRVWELPTKDQNRASQMIRFKLSKSHGLGYALRRRKRVKANGDRQQDGDTPGSESGDDLFKEDGKDKDE